MSSSTATTDSFRGVVVGGSNRGVYNSSDENAASAAGQAVQVAIYGRVKMKVDGSTAAISIGDPLTSTATAALAAKATSGGTVIGRALQPSSAFGDYILVDVTREGVL